MFVKSNTLGEIKSYFKSELSPFFSENEIKSILKDLSAKRLNLNPIEFISSSDLKLSESDILFFHSALKRLKNNEPFQYILGESWFYDLNLIADSRGLIPRPETEELVDWVHSDFKSIKNPRIMDLCSGSGCVALALKSVLSVSEIVATEYSQEALTLIEDNKKRTSLNIDIQSMNVLNAEDYKMYSPNSFDCWVSNPPYIPEVDKQLMSENVLEHEPHMALFVSDDDALVFYREIALKSLVYLKEGAALYFEIHERFAQETMELLKELGFVNIEVRKDLQGRDRMMKALKVSSRHEPK